MNLASKDYVDTQVSSMANSMVPDWSNVSSITSIPSAGYTVPGNGVIICIIKPNSGQTIRYYANGAQIAFSSLDGSTLRFVVPVGEGDVITTDGSGTKNVQFVPYKTLNPST